MISCLAAFADQGETLYRTSIHTALMQIDSSV